MRSGVWKRRHIWGWQCAQKARKKTGAPLAPHTGGQRRKNCLQHLREGVGKIKLCVGGKCLPRNEGGGNFRRRVMLSLKRTKGGCLAASY